MGDLFAKRTASPEPEASLDPANVRLHSAEGEDAVRRSLAELGAGRSVVLDRDGVAIGGNLTLQEARKQGLPVRLIHTDGTELVAVVRDDLATDDPRRQALAVADNRTGELSYWDTEALAAMARGISEDSGGEALSAVMGFSLEDLAMLCNQTEEEAAPPPATEADAKSTECSIAIKCSDEAELYEVQQALNIDSTQVHAAAVLKALQNAGGAKADTRHCEQ